jgi:hypothetical protein
LTKSHTFGAQKSLQLLSISADRRSGGSPLAVDLTMHFVARYGLLMRS